MENNFPSLVLSTMLSSTQKENEFFDESKSVSVVGVPLVRLIKLFGFQRALGSKIVRWRYIRRLWILREIYIMKVLLEYSEKVPKGTPSYLIVNCVKRSRVMKSLIFGLEKRLLDKLIRKPCEIKKINNESSSKEE